MELQKKKSSESSEVPIWKTVKDKWYLNKDNQNSPSYHRIGNGFSPSPQKDNIKIKIKSGKIVEHQTASNGCVQAVENCNIEGPSFDQMGMDTDAYPDHAVKDNETEVLDTTCSADGSIFTDGDDATKDIPSSNVSHLSASKVSPTREKNDLKIKIKSGKIVEHHTESNGCVQAVEYCNIEGPSFDQMGMDTDTHPDHAVEVLDTTSSADGSTFTDDGEDATIKDISSSNVSHLSVSKVSPTPEKNDLKIKIKCGKIVQSSIDIDKVEKVEKVIEGSEVGLDVGSERKVNVIQSEIQVTGTSANTTKSDVGASVVSQKNSSDLWNYDYNYSWKKKTESRCGMPRIEQDSTRLDLFPPFKINPSLSISIGGGEKSKSPTLRGSPFQEATDGHCGMKSNIVKTTISQTKRKSSKSIQPKASDKRQNKLTKRKTGKSLGFKLKRTLLIVRRTCRKCLKKSSTFSMNINHEQLEHPHICKICTDGLFSFIDKNDLKRHKEKVHLTETFDDDDEMVARIPEVLERKSSGLKVTKEADNKMVPLRNSNDRRSGNTSIKDESSKQTEQEENFTLKPDKQVDFNKNETLPDDGNLKIIPLNNFIETGTYLVTKPTINENGTSWKMEKIEECAKMSDAHLEKNQMQYEVAVTLSEGVTSVINAGPIENMCSINSQTQTTNLTASTPATVAMVSPWETSHSVKVETSSSAAIPKSVAIGMQGVNMFNPMSRGNAGVIRGNVRAGLMQASMRGNFGAGMLQPPMRGNLRTGMIQPPMRGNFGARMMQPPMRGNLRTGMMQLPMRGNLRTGMMQPPMRGNLRTGMMQPPMRGNLGARMIKPPLRGGRGVQVRGGSAVPLIRGVRPRMHMGRGVVGVQGIRPLGVSANLGTSGVRGAQCRPQLLDVCGAQRAPFHGGMRPQIKRKSVAPISARPLGVQVGHTVPQPGDHKLVPARRVSIGSIVPDANLPTAFQPKIVKVETVNLSDDESPPSANVNNVLNHLMSCGISVTRNKTPTIPKSLEIPPGISLTPASMSFNSQSRKNGFSSDEVADSSYSITPILKEPS